MGSLQSGLQAVVDPTRATALRLLLSPQTTPALHLLCSAAVAVDGAGSNCIAVDSAVWTPRTQRSNFGTLARRVVVSNVCLHTVVFLEC